MNRRFPFLSFLAAILLLGACQLEVADPESHGTALPIERTMSSTQAFSTIASTSAYSGPATRSPSATRPAEDARTILQKSAVAMLAVASYDYTAESTEQMAEDTKQSKISASMFPERGDGKIVTVQNEQTHTTYLKNHRMYMLDSATNRWLYLEMPAEDPLVIQIDDRVNDFMSVTSEPWGWTLTSTKPLSALEFYSLTGIEKKEAAALANMASQGQTMETMVTFELDEAYRYKTVIYEQVTTTSGIRVHSTSIFHYSRYDAAKPVVVPQEILTQATPFDPNRP